MELKGIVLELALEGTSAVVNYAKDQEAAQPVVKEIEPFELKTMIDADQVRSTVPQICFRRQYPSV